MDGGSIRRKVSTYTQGKTHARTQAHAHTHTHTHTHTYIFIYWGNGEIKRIRTIMWEEYAIIFKFRNKLRCKWWVIIICPTDILEDNINMNLKMRGFGILTDSATSV
jgi:hypothetical protein